MVLAVVPETGVNRLFCWGTIFSNGLEQICSQPLLWFLENEWNVLFAVSGLTTGPLFPPSSLVIFPVPARVGAVTKAKLIMEQGMVNRLFCPCSSLMSITHRGMTQGDMNINKALVHESSVNIFDMLWHNHQNIEAKVQTRCQHSLHCHFSLAPISLESHNTAIANRNA